MYVYIVYIYIYICVRVCVCVYMCVHVCLKFSDQISKKEVVVWREASRRVYGGLCWQLCTSCLKTNSSAQAAQAGCESEKSSREGRPARSARAE